MSNTLPPSLYVACDSCPRKSLRTDPFPRCRQCGNRACPACTEPRSQQADGDHGPSLFCRSCAADADAWGV